MMPLCCKIKGCRGYPEYYIPADLCKKHWQMWFDHKLIVVKKKGKRPYAYVIK